MLYTVIRHDLCKSLGLNLLEYVILDIISQQCRNISMNGWAVIDKKGIGELVGVSDAKAWNIICKLAQFEFIEINDLAKQMRVTDKFLSVVNGQVQSAECRVQEDSIVKEEKKKVNSTVNKFGLLPNEMKHDDKTEYTEAQVLEFKKCQKWIRENTYLVTTIKEQLRIDEYFTLISRVSKLQLMELLRAMHNRPDLKKKYTSVYLTLSKWISDNAKK